MDWVAYAMIAYYVINGLWTVLKVGDVIEITPPGAVATLIAYALLVWGVVHLATT